MQTIDSPPAEFTPIVSRRQLIGWNVDVNGELVKVLISDLPIPDYPSVHQIRHAARAKLIGEPADKIALALAIDEAWEMAVCEWNRSETIRRACVRLAGCDYKKACQLINRGECWDSLLRFDLAAVSAAYEIPDLGWNPEESNCDALWEIVSTKAARKPQRADHAIRMSACAALTLRRVPVEIVPF